MAAVGAALITKEQGADATSSVPREKKGFLRSRDVSVPPQSGQWAVVQGLQKANYTGYNDTIVRVGSQRDNGRFETFSLGTGVKLTVRPENLRGLLESHDEYSAGEGFLTKTVSSSCSVLISRRNVGLANNRRSRKMAVYKIGICGLLVCEL